MPRYRILCKSPTSFHTQSFRSIRSQGTRRAESALLFCKNVKGIRFAPFIGNSGFRPQRRLFFSRALPKHASPIVVASGLGGHRASLHRVNMSGLASLTPFPANTYMGRYGMGLMHFPPFGERQPSAPPAPHLADMRLAIERFYKGDFVSLLVQERPVYVSEYVFVG